MGQVGLVLGIEMSRLARAGRDWHQLVELCSLSQTLLADADGVYDPNASRLSGVPRRVMNGGSAGSPPRSASHPCSTRTVAAVSGVIRCLQPIWPEAAEKVRIIAGAAEASVRAAIAAGVKIAMGADAPVYPHGKNLRELELLVRAGMKPARRCTPLPCPPPS